MSASPGPLTPGSLQRVVDGSEVAVRCLVLLAISTVTSGVGACEMSCCHCASIGGQFGESAAKRDVERYRRKGADKTTRILIDAVRAHESQQVSLLDIGGGIGAVHHELLAGTAATAINVDASSAYLAAAREESERRGHAERVSFVHGDFVDLAEELPQADIVTLDRVICCYPDLEDLVGASVAKSRRLYAVSYPRDRWYVRLGVAAENAARWLLRNPFRGYVHPTARLDELVVGAGFKRCLVRSAFAWQIAVYARSYAGQRSGAALGGSAV